MPAFENSRHLLYSPAVHFPKSIRLSADVYADPDMRFHLTIAAHPEIRELSTSLRGVIWRSVLEHRSSDRVRLFTACLMPDHLHLLVGPGEKSIIAFVQQWKSWSTRLAWTAGHSGPLWQPGVWDRAIRGTVDFDVVCHYVLDNPVKARLVEKPEDWAWSWAYWMDEPT